jgi:hypothetical protein
MLLLLGADDVFWGLRDTYRAAEKSFEGHIRLCSMLRSTAHGTSSVVQVPVMFRCVTERLINPSMDSFDFVPCGDLQQCYVQVQVQVPVSAC